MRPGLRLGRRALLASLVAIAGAGAGVHHWRRLKRPSASHFVALIQSRLAHLELDAAGVEQFAREYVRRHGAFAAAVYHRQTLGGLLRIDALRALLPDAREQRLLSFERHLVSLYLRSTDHFTPGRTTPVRYVAFADPYEVGCANPLARL